MGIETTRSIRGVFKKTPKTRQHAGPQDDFEADPKAPPVIYSSISPKALNLQTEPKTTALHTALIDNNADLVGILKQMKPEELGEQDSNGNTPLHLAINQENFTFATTLVEKMSPHDLHTKNNEGKNPIELLTDLRNVQEKMTIEKDNIMAGLINKIALKNRLTEAEFKHFKEISPTANDRYVRTQDPKTSTNMNTKEK